MSIQSITNSGFSGTKARSIVKAETEPVNIYKMSYEVVAGAGGGGGGRNHPGWGGHAGAGGGSGGKISGFDQIFDLGTNYAVSIGAGGNKGNGYSAPTNANNGSSGSNTTLAYNGGTFTAVGGGYGSSGSYNYEGNSANGGNGGSGGGGGSRFNTYYNYNAGGAGGTGTAGQGQNGAYGVQRQAANGGGGGGFTNAGKTNYSVNTTPSSSGQGHAGGDGLDWTNHPSFEYIKGGQAGSGISGSANTGTGGTGGNANGNGGNGGSGLVYLQYRNELTITVGAGLTASTTIDTDSGLTTTYITAGSDDISFALT